MSQNWFQGAVFSVPCLTSPASSSITQPLGQSSAAPQTHTDPGRLEVCASQGTDHLGCKPSEALFTETISSTLGESEAHVPVGWRNQEPG